MRRLYFLGVSTGGSSIMTIFPRWASALGLDAEICGVDLPVGSPSDRISIAVEDLVSDPYVAGALVTTHKSAVYEAAHSQFDVLDPQARLCREISCLAVRSRRLLGWAKDPITSRQAYRHLLGPDPWTASATDVVCFGAGGAGLALTVAVLSEDRQPRRFVLADRDPARLDLARQVVAELPVRAELELRLIERAADADALMSSAAPGSLVVNATGMGKDSPGSPVSSQAQFPDGGTAWDMNYRGDLVFLDLAREQSVERGLLVADGWRYFLHGWTEVISEVFEVTVDAEQFALLDEIAAQATGRAMTTRGVGRG